MNKPAPIDTKPLVEAINAQLLATGLRSKTGEGSKLYFFGNDFMGPTWILDGMTPVQIGFVVETLKDRKADLTKIIPLLTAYDDSQSAQNEWVIATRKSARAKLNDDERELLGLKES